MFKYVLVSMLILGAKTCNNKAVEQKDEVMNTQDASYQLHNIWALEGMLDQDINKEAFPLGVPTLEIFLEDMRIGGFAGCNNYTGQITSVDDANIELGPIAATKKMCQSGAFSETLYLGLLQKTTNYNLDGMKLNLLKNDSILLSFKKVD